MEIMVFYITCPDEATASSIIHQLIDHKLAACGNIFPVKSEYIWMNAYCNENEYVAWVKTMPAAEANIESMVKKIHPYETPCIMRWRVAVNEEYGKWVESSVSVSE